MCWPRCCSPGSDWYGCSAGAQPTYSRLPGHDGRVTTESVDVVVIGLGPGGEALTTELATAGLSVTGVDARLVGGECPYYACVPTKMMIRAADALSEARRVRELAGSAQVTPDWAPVAARIRNEATDNW